MKAYALLFMMLTACSYMGLGDEKPSDHGYRTPKEILLQVERIAARRIK